MLSAYIRGWLARLFRITMFASTGPQAHAALAHGVATAHAMAAIILLSALALHLLGVSYHLLLCKDGVVQRMLPDWPGRRPRSEPAARS
jgi:cytochrome b561